MVDKVEIELEMEDKAAPLVVENEDGTATIDFDPRPPELETARQPERHTSNLAESGSSSSFGHLASSLLMEIDADIASRSEWEQTYEKGLKLLGLDEEQKTEPWPGACGVYHPMMLEALYRFQAQAMSELMPAAGPAKTKVVGKVTDARTRQALRIQRDLNYNLTEVVDDYRDETEKLLLNCGAAGSAFRKWYFDDTNQRPACDFVPAEDLIVPYGAKTLMQAPRVTHRMRKTTNEIKKLQKSGLYRADVELYKTYPHIDDLQQTKDEMAGIEHSGRDVDLHTIYEVHADVEVPGFEDPDGIARPHVITIDKDTMTVLAIYRNWREGDMQYRKVQSFIHYSYAPGFGFYGNGLVHLMYGTTKAATAAERQLIDAGTLANIPAGLKTRGLRINAPSDPVIPGEFRDVDLPSGMSIRDNIMFMPYKEPSATLNNLKNEMVEEGRRAGSSADIKLSEMSAQAPVGTTLALIERATKMQSAVHARLHAAMKNELRLVAEIIRDHMPPAYPFEVEDEANREADYDDRVDVIPVSDPNASTMAHRLMQMQAVAQLVQQDPDAFNKPELYKNYLNVLGVDDIEKVLNLPEEAQPRDPVTENMAVINGEPVKAAMWQDHEAHIRTHMAALQDPKIQELLGQSPNAEAILAAMEAHIREHVAYEYRNKIEEKMGVALPPLDEQLPPQVEPELSRLTADAAERVLADSEREMANKEAREQAQDPLTQIQLAELDIKRQDADRKDRETDARILREDRELQINERKIMIDAGLKAENDQVKRRDEQQKTAASLEQQQADRAMAQDKQALEDIKVSKAIELDYLKIENDREQAQAKLDLEYDKLKHDAQQQEADRKAGLDEEVLRATGEITRAVIEADSRERENKDQIALARQAQEQTQTKAKKVK